MFSGRHTVACRSRARRAQNEGTGILLLSAAQHSRNVCRGAAKSASRAICGRLAKGLAGLQYKAGFNRPGISQRLIPLVLDPALPLVIVGVAGDPVCRANAAFSMHRGADPCSAAMHG